VAPGLTGRPWEPGAGRIGGWPLGKMRIHAHERQSSPPARAPIRPPPGRPGGRRRGAPGPPALPWGWHWHEWFAELIGTAVLVLGGLSAVALDFGRHSPVAEAIHSASLRRLVTGVLFATTGSLVAVSPLGRRSGAHLNPAVTVAFATQGHVHRGDVVGYAAFQTAGAVLGAALVRLAWGGAGLAIGVTSPGRGLSPPAVLAVEALMTGVYVLVLFAFLSSSRTARWTPVANVVAVAVLVWQGAPYTGTSLNPARTFGPDLVLWVWPAFWVYVAGPLAGALLAAVAWAPVPRHTLTAKLFHDRRYRTVLASLLPARPPGPEPVQATGPGGRGLSSWRGEATREWSPTAPDG